MDETSWKTQPRNGVANAPESVGGHRKTRERVVLGRIEAERHDQCARRKSTDRLFGGAERLRVAVVPGADRQRKVEIATKPGPGAARLRIAPNKRAEDASIG